MVGGGCDWLNSFRSVQLEIASDNLSVELEEEGEWER
jgi:hypothetical protein